jgi:hypothetical protein
VVFDPSGGGGAGEGEGVCGRDRGRTPVHTLPRVSEPHPFWAYFRSLLLLGRSLKGSGGRGCDGDAGDTLTYCLYRTKSL